MMEVPKGWAVAPLQSIFVILNGFAFKSKEYVSSGYRVVRIANVQQGRIVDDEPQFYKQNNELGKYELFEGDLLMSLTGNVGRVGLIPSSMLPAYLNQRVACLRVVNKELMSSKYLFYCLNNKHFENSCITSSKGVAQKNISTVWLRDYLMPLPPLAEQHRIVAKIDALFSKLDKGMETLQTIRQQLRTYRQAVLKWAFEGLTETKRINECFDITGGLTKNSKRNILPLQMPYIRVANVYYNYLDLKEIKTIGVEQAEIERTTLQKGDLLFVEGNGSRDQIGRVAQWNGEIEDCLHQNHIIKGRPLGSMLGKFAIYFLMTEGGRTQIRDVSSSTSGLYTLSTNKVKSLLVPFCTIEEQAAIVAAIDSRLSVCDKLEAIVDESLVKAEALRQSILKKAFAGQLVPQDPDDEPADVLLERIRKLKVAK